jgi:hypothetical protein
MLLAQNCGVRRDDVSGDKPKLLQESIVSKLYTCNRSARTY